jgi:hypothetical protein
MAETQKFYTPWLQMEQIDVDASAYFKNSSPSLWKNGFDKPIHLTQLLIDSNSSTTTSVKFGKRNRGFVVDTFVSTLALHNVERFSNQATDCAGPLWKFDRRYPVLVPPKQILEVELTDLAAAARVANVQLHGYRLCDPSEPVVLTDRISIASLGSMVAQLKTDPKGPIIATDLLYYLEETGTVAKLRGLKSRISGAGFAPWMSTGIRGTVMFPNRQGGAAVLELDPVIDLMPGETLELEFIDTDGGAITVYVGAIGYTEDRRTR